ncbi:MAG: hypothetical protein LBL95_00480 [Deltaproteobacteria bacterium]|nr:hypothetical protein [Deltaproteobacteria bacterium]
MDQNDSPRARLLPCLVLAGLMGLASLLLARPGPALARLAGDLAFCGERVPLSRTEVHESIDQELLLLSEAKSRVWLTLRRSERFLPVIDQALRQSKVPLDFRYLPMAMTNLAPDFRSGGRQGLWRLSEPEAVSMGLLVNKDVDERLDPVASSLASAERIAALGKSAGGWTMALASFLDPSAVSAAVAQAGQEDGDFFALYVPESLDKAVSLVLAGKILYSAPEDYGYRLTQAWPVLANGRRRIEAAQDMRALAGSLKVDYRTFRDMNPHILGDSAPAGSYLNVP